MRVAARSLITSPCWQRSSVLRAPSSAWRRCGAVSVCTRVSGSGARPRSAQSCSDSVDTEPSLTRRPSSARYLDAQFLQPRARLLLADLDVGLALEEAVVVVIVLEADFDFTPLVDQVADARTQLSLFLPNLGE